MIVTLSRYFQLQIIVIGAEIKLQSWNWMMASNTHCKCFLSVSSFCFKLPGGFAIIVDNIVGGKSLKESNHGLVHFSRLFIFLSLVTEVDISPLFHAAELEKNSVKVVITVTGDSGPLED